MTIPKLQFSFTVLAKRLMGCLLGAVMVLGMCPAIATASPLPEATPHSSLIALAASSRFAAQAENEGQEARISESRLQEMREQRREWQSEASANAAEAAEEAAEEDGTAEDRLNLEEIRDENEILD